jgi:hypothetical protein
LPDRFWRLCLPAENGCWEWITAKRSNGYARFVERVGEERITWLAHRYAYTALVSPIPDGLVIDHLCRAPWCVNPEHLEAVPHRINTLRGHGACAVHARKTHCPRGHPYDDQNTRYDSRGRRCRACERVSWEKVNERRKRERADRRSSALLRGRESP